MDEWVQSQSTRGYTSVTVCVVYLIAQRQRVPLRAGFLRANCGLTQTLTGNIASPDSETI